MRHLTMITETPLQVYSSALSFSPAKSEVRKKFWEQRSIVQDRTFIGGLANQTDEWDMCLQTLDVGKRIYDVVFSPNDKLFATVSEIVYIWDAATGIRLQEFHIDSGCKTHIAFSADSETLTLASPNEVQVMDALTGACRETFKPDCSVDLIVCSPDGKLLALAAGITIKIFDCSTWTLKHTLEEHTQPIVYMKFSSDSKIFASISSDKSLRLWNSSKWTCSHDFELLEIPTTLCFSPNNQFIAFMFPCTAYVGNKQTGEGAEVKETRWMTLLIESGKWDDRLLTEYRPGCMAFAPDDKIIAFASTDYNLLGIYDVLYNTHVSTFSHGDLPDCMAFSNDSRTLVSVSSDGLAKMWEVSCEPQLIGDLDFDEEFEEPEFPDGHEGEVTASQISPKGKFLATGGVNSEVRIWDPASKEMQRRLRAPGKTSHLAWSPDGNLLAAVAGTERGPEICVWNVESDFSVHWRAPQNKIPRCDIPTLAFEFSPNGTEIVFTAERGTMHLWDIGSADNARHFELKGYDAPISQFSFSNDGKTLATRAKFEGAQVWDLATRTCKATLVERNEDNEEVTCISLSLDDRILVSATSRRVMQVWDIAQGICKQTIPVDIEVKELSFTDDGKYLTTGHDLFAFTGEGVLAKTPTSNQLASALYINESWVMKTGQRLLRIPSDYNPKAAVAYQNTVALGGAGGQVVFLDLANS